MVKNAGMSECPECKGSGRGWLAEGSQSLGSGRPLHEPIQEQQWRPVTCQRCKGSGYVDLKEEAKRDAAHHAEFLARKEKEAEEQLAKKAANLVAAAKRAAEVERLQPLNREMERSLRLFTEKRNEKRVAEQLASLAKLRSEGSLTEKEFQTLKTRLISGGKL